MVVVVVVVVVVLIIRCEGGQECAGLTLTDTGERERSSHLITSLHFIKGEFFSELAL